MSKETQAYIVEKKHCCGHEIGAEVQLTKAKAKAWVGKVRLKADLADESKLAEAAGKAQERANELEAEVADLKNEVGRLTSQLTQAKKKAK